jgi:energy-converting hydrogenase Eha subunit G
MIFSNPIACCQNYFLFSLVIWAIAGYTYHVNSQRAAEDPKKKEYHPAAVFLAPITWPLFVLGFISIFILKAFLYGIFLVVFTIAIVVIRKPFLIVWLKKIITAIGNKLLEANTLLIRLVIGERRENNSQPA